MANPLDDPRADVARSCRVLLFIAVVLALVAGGSSAATYQTSPTGGVWNSAFTWNCVAPGPPGGACSGFPGNGGVSDDVATIMLGAPVTLASAVPSPVHLTITGNSTLSIATGGQLPLWTGVNLVDSGSLSVDGGTLLIPPGGSLEFNGAAGPYLTMGSGLIRNDGTMNLNGGSPLGTTFNWAGGVLTGAGQTNVGGGIAPATIRFFGEVGPMILDGHLIVNNGTLDYFTPGNNLYLANAARIENAAAFDIKTNVNILPGAGASSLIINTGTLTKSGGNTFVFSVPFNNAGDVAFATPGDGLGLYEGGTHSGRFNSTQVGGSFILRATNTFTQGSVFFSGPGSIQNFGTFVVDTDLTEQMALNNDGQIVFGPSSTHALYVIAPFTQSPAGSVTIRLNGTTAVSQYDFLQVSAPATLGGTLNLTVLGGYSPADGAIYTPVKFFGGNAGSTFATINMPNPNGYMTATYTPSVQTATQLDIRAFSIADIEVTKSGPASVLNGQPATYLVTVRNLGPASASNIRIDDTFSGASLGNVVSPMGPCSGTGPVSCIISGVGVGGTTNITYTLVPTAVGTLTNSAAVISSVPADPNSANNAPPPISTIVNPAADLSIAKTAAPSPVNAGAPFTYTLTVNNAGPDAASSVTVSDTLPAGTTLTSVAPPPGWTCSVSGSSVSCYTPSLAASASAVIPIAATAPNAGGSIVNTATVTSTTGDANLADNTASVTTVVTAQADLSVAKSGTATQFAGNQVTYTVTVTNLGPSNAVGVTVSDPTPAGLTWLSSSGACTAFPCSVGTLAAGASATITSTYSAGPAAVPTVTNTATASATTADPVSTNNSAGATTTINPAADLSITKSPTSPTATAGQNVVFNITVTNLGPSTANNVTVSDPAPSGATLVSNSGGCLTAFPCNVGTLAAGASASITSTWAIASNVNGSLVNTASVSASDPADLQLSNNSASAAVSVGQATDISVSKSGPSAANPLSTVIYNVTITNLGPSDASSVTITDPTPAGLTFVSNSGACTTPYPCSIGPLTAGATAPISSTYAVAVTSGSVTNTVSVPAAPLDPPSNNVSSVTTTITPVADLQITKSGPATHSTSASLRFAITVRNLGPSDAAGVIVSDPTPAGTMFVANGGDCTSAFPCDLGSIPAGGSRLITASYAVLSGTLSVSNTASVRSSTADPASSNDSATANVAVTPCPIAPQQTNPQSGAVDVPVSGTLEWTGVGATSYEVYFGPAGSGCSTLAGTFAATSFSYSGLAEGATYESRIVAIRAGCPPQSSACATWTTHKQVIALPSATLLEPPPNSTVASPVTFRWSAVAGATVYRLFMSLNGAAFTEAGTTGETSLTAAVGNGSVQWYVVASCASGCSESTSAKGAFNTCTLPDAPLAGVVGAPTSGQPYAVSWPAVSGAVSYVVDEANDETFTYPQRQTTSQTSVTFSHTTITEPRAFFYRVNAVGACSATPGPPSKTIRVVILPPPVRHVNVNFDIPAGTLDRVQLPVVIDGDPSGPQRFEITLDKPWMIRVDPPTGIVPVDGITVMLTVDPSQLPNGTFTGTLLVTYSTIEANGRQTSNATTGKSVPVTINLVTPIVPSTLSGPTADTIIIPTVGRLNGINSQWRSDVRLFNGTGQSLKYQLDFLPSQATESKRTTLSTAAGDTTALDDIIHNWYGFGEVGDSASGILQIRPLTSAGVSTSLAGSVISSRTYNNTAAKGTLGQFIPGILYRDFIGRQTDASKPGAVLSLQQLAQSSTFRSNLGLIEASGAPATVVLSVLNPAGLRLTDDIVLSLKGGEQMALNQVLAQKGLTANDARIEVRVTGGEGKVSAYASVIDNMSLDPLLVSPVILGQTTAQKYVIPGVADVNTGAASWRSDLRILNGGSSAQTVNVMFYRQGDPGNPLSAAMTVNPGEVKVLDSVLSSLFGASNTGGAVHVNTAGDSQLVVTGRTFSQTANGTLGQFIPAATLDDAIDRVGGALHILQVEDSVRYRTNVGLAEIGGSSATVEVRVNLPDSKATPTVQINLAPNEFRQFALRDLGLSNVYNARISLQVIDGGGKVTAYGSVIDMLTSDPTYVPAQ